jgi:hypothetical protein
LPDAVAFARTGVCRLLAARPALVHQLPPNEARRGGAWPSPRTWEMAVRLIAFATAAGTSREVLSMLVRGVVGDGPGLELLAGLDRMELPDPEDLLADPAGAGCRNAVTCARPCSTGWSRRSGNDPGGHAGRRPGRCWCTR